MSIERKPSSLVPPVSMRNISGSGLSARPSNFLEKILFEKKNFEKKNTF